MTFAQLRTFLAVAEAGSVRGAAERLVVSQPSVSASVGSLERELGVDLVTCQGPRAAPHRGRTGFCCHRSPGPRAARVGRPEGDEHRRTRSRSGQGGGSDDSGRAPAPPTHRRLPQGAPRSGRDRGGGQPHFGLGGALRSRRDLVVAGRPPVALGARTLARAANTLIAHRPGRQDKAAPVPARELAGETWLLREEGSGTRDATEELLRRLAIKPRTMILGSNGAVEAAVAAGLGVALISRYAVADRLADGTISVWECPGTPLERPWHLVSHGTEPLSPTARLLVASMAGTTPGFVLTGEGRRLLSR